MHMHYVVRQFADPSGDDSAPIREDAKLISHAAREGQLLFD
jgi:hypothetical protein